MSSIPAKNKHEKEMPNEMETRLKNFRYLKAVGRQLIVLLQTIFLSHHGNNNNSVLSEDLTLLARLFGFLG